MTKEKKSKKLEQKPQQAIESSSLKSNRRVFLGVVAKAIPATGIFLFAPNRALSQIIGGGDCDCFDLNPSQNPGDPGEPGGGGGECTCGNGNNLPPDPPPPPPPTCSSSGANACSATVSANSCTSPNTCTGATQANVCTGAGGNSCTGDGTNTCTVVAGANTCAVLGSNQCFGDGANTCNPTNANSS